MYDWEEAQEPDGKVVAKLCDTQVLVYRAGEGAPQAWRWEAQFAVGQIQSGYAEDPDEALEKGERVAERFLS